ncbi:MAG: hypothetical protein AAGA68_18175 [Pseudomonadota bacterium]
MPQLHFYVPEDIADAVRRRAQARNMPLSRYLAEIVRREVAGWPEEFAGTLGAWQGDEPPLPGGGSSKRDRK